jgi:hypothetical protein
MTIAEKNAVIASFMGYEKYYANGYWNFIYEDDNHRTDVDLHYHHDWDWLMECVSKIESLGFIFSIKGQSSAIRDEKTRQYLQIRLIGEDSTKIESVYNNCFQFIQWYNQKQKTK